MLRILQASDIHEEKRTLDKYLYIRDIANQHCVDAIVLNGDFFFTQELEIVERERANATQRFMRWVDYADRKLLKLYMEVSGFGGIERLKETIKSPELDDESKNKFKELARKYEQNKARIDGFEAQYESLINFNNKLLCKDLKKVQDEINREAQERFRRLDKIFSQCRAPVYMVRGNWETDNFYGYKWEHAKILEKSDIVNIKGVRFAGAPNWYERLARMPDEMYQHAEIEPATGYGKALMDFDIGLLQCKTDEERQAYVQNVLLESQVFRRLDGKQFDVLVTHKGPHSLAAEGDNHYGSGIGLETIINVVKPKIILAGHVHKSLILRENVSPDYSYQGIRTSDDTFYVLDIDTNTKEIVNNGILPYKWVEDVKYAA
ncbi:MAG: metallophosphoesterase [Candidatus Woesearchaeota archaeon]